MPRNVEVKATVHDVAALRDRIDQITDTPVEVFNQQDTFYVTTHGRLKLRISAPDRCELIYYERPNEAAAKPSSYEIIRSGDPATFSRIMGLVLPTRGSVAKRRLLYHIGQTRIHVDTVKDLGTFVELEVVLSEDQSTEDGRRIAERLMEILCIPQESLVPEAYIDLLEAKR